MMGRIYTALRMNAMPSPDLPADYHSHYLHCIDYLRQATMCAGDVAVEAHEPTDASDNGALDGGWSGHHGESTTSSEQRSCEQSRRQESSEARTKE